MGTEAVTISLAIFIHFGILSFMAIGGGVIALAPEMRRFVVDTHPWMSNATFVDCFALAQAAPGPNMLFVTLVGLQAAGLLGALSATTAIIGPPAIFALLWLRARDRHTQLVSYDGFREAFVPLSVGMIVATAWSLGDMVLGAPGDVLLFAIAVAALTFARLNPLWLLLAGGIASSTGWV